MILKRLSIIFIAVFFMQGSLVTQASENLEVIFETSMGSFTLVLDPVKAPKTVENFLAYIDEGFYDGTLLHRAIPEFVIQGGGFEPGMKYKEPRAPVKNESSNRLKNLRGTISMARRTHPDTATSQFYINLSHNTSLDYISDLQPGYTVFGRISKGMDVIDKISVVETTTVDRSKNVPKEDIVLLSVKRKAPVEPVKSAKEVSAPVKIASAPVQKANVQEYKQVYFTAGEHYVVLDTPVPTRDPTKVEVVEMFSYGCPYCYEFEPLIKAWSKQQASDVDFWFFPAVWNKPMELYARAFYTARELNVLEKIHDPLFNAVVVKHRSIRNTRDMADFFSEYGVDKKAFNKTFDSAVVEKQVKLAATRVRSYKPAGAPEMVINGKYRIDRMRSGSLAEMLAVAEFLINKERATLKKQ